MKIKYYLLCLFLEFILLFPGIVLSQQTTYSWGGCGLRSNQHCRVLNLFINVIYDVHPDTNDVFTLNDWPKVADPNLEGVNNAGLPTYLLGLMDTAYVPGHLNGVITRLYGESSFDSLQIIGDFVVVNVCESRVRRKGSFNYPNIVSAAVDLINANGGLHTLYGHDQLSDYQMDQSALPAYSNVLIRNITKSYGGINEGSGFNTVCPVVGVLIGEKKYTFPKGTIQCVGSGNVSRNPTSILVHEMSHSLFGGNDFHTSGGNHRGYGCPMSFPCIQYGYGLMGAAGSGLVGCNGYERWRMHWKHPEACTFIAARNMSDAQSIPSDISMEDGAVSFLLRDFVTYGDVVRIRLPYKDAESSSNQYIWLENHKVGVNGKLDFLQYSNEFDCRPTGVPGIYAYYQVGRDVLEGDASEVRDQYDRDNLRIIPAEGYFDYEKRNNQYNLSCVSYGVHDYELVRVQSNPFCGAQDQQMHLFPTEGQDSLTKANEQVVWRVIKDGRNIDSLCSLGDNRDAFSHYTHLNMGTNPSTCNAITCHSKNDDQNSIIHAEKSLKDTRTTYLTGLGIELIPAGDLNVIVKVRWDDYDIVNDARWTGNIALKDTARLCKGKTITLAQNRTVTQVTRDVQTGLFATATTLTCEPGSYFQLDTNASVVITEGSTLNVMRGGSLVLKSGATIVVDTTGTLVLEDTARLEKDARILVRPGGTLIVDGGTLTSASDNGMWEGIYVEGHRNQSQTPTNQGDRKSVV